MSIDYLHSIHNSHENSQCFECKKKRSSWACTELCIFLCVDCAHKLKNENSEFFNIKSLSMSVWTDNEIEKLSNGGNLRLRSLMNQYNLTDLENLSYKYCNKALDYYKKLLNSEVFNYPSPTPPSVEEGTDYLFTHKLSFWQRTVQSFRGLTGNPKTEQNGATEPGRFSALCGLRELSCTYATEKLNSISEAFQPNYAKMEESDGGFMNR